MGKEVVSIVIPVYKTEKYLKDCLNSILHQSFKDWECILVDDGSPDGCGEICDCYHNKDNRFLVLHKKNEGVTAARRDGVGLSSGDWILFVDSDDVIPRNAIKDLYEKSTCNNVDIVIGAWEKSVNGKKRIIPLMTQGYVSSDKLIRKYLEGKCYGGPVGKLFRKSLFADDIFDTPPAVKLNEDLIMNLKIARLVKGAYALPRKVVYTYVAHNESASRNILNNDWEQTFTIIENTTPEHLKTSFYNYICQMYWFYPNLPETKAYYTLCHEGIEGKIDIITSIYKRAVVKKTPYWRLFLKTYMLLLKIEKLPSFLYYILFK